MPFVVARTPDGLSVEQFNALGWLRAYGCEKAKKAVTEYVVMTRPDYTNKRRHNNMANHAVWLEELRLIKEYSRVWSDAH